MLKTNYPASLCSITQTSKELVAVEKALIFETSGLLWAKAPGKRMHPWGLLTNSCDWHVLWVCNVWLPRGENKAMHFEDEAILLDRGRSGSCVLCRKQNPKHRRSLDHFLLGKVRNLPVTCPFCTRQNQCPSCCHFGNFRKWTCRHVLSHVHQAVAWPSPSALLQPDWQLSKVSSQNSRLLEATWWCVTAFFHCYQNCLHWMPPLSPYSSTGQTALKCSTE